MSTILKNVGIIILLITISMVAFNVSAKLPLPKAVTLECNSVTGYFSFAHTQSILHHTIDEAYANSEVDYPNEQDFVREVIYLVYSTKFESPNDRANHLVGIREICTEKALMRNGLQPRQFDF